MPKAVYIHIPFCNRICPYCDFTKYVLRGQPVKEYLFALRKEMEVMVATNPPQQINTIFVGGGTPSTLTPEQMGHLFDSITSIFPLAENIEFTMEVNPECINEEKLKVMKAGGVNRLSFGVQTFDPTLLKKLGRLHTKEHVFSAIRQAKEVGFTNLSIDLMFGLPEQSLASLEKTLELAFSLPVTHFSTYSLQVEEGTHFYRLDQKGKLSLPTEDEEVRMFELIIRGMEKHGFYQYEISNFAINGFESKHNLTYWRNEEYYGVGVGAHGYVRGVRYANVSLLDQYMEWVNESGLAQETRHKVTRQEAMEEQMMLGLRTKQGVHKEVFLEKFGVELESVYGRQLKDLLTSGLLETDGSRYYLSKKGMFLGNEVFAQFLQD